MPVTAQVEFNAPPEEAQEVLSPVLCILRISIIPSTSTLQINQENRVSRFLSTGPTSRVT
ncbi:uncharacterized protein RAG0_04583 [Rhynchosporium agropyri]|uniref:Uncharacterized protein n=1 Tax=Rhynchosporium agropyri TaxID=914238 RepID=A0A1E1K9R7_9HELO|nr:uncharacterized protein RAG0_04583 [Rhynchosporium agropyri]